MMRQGPIPLFLHSVLGYAIGALFIAAPFLFAFDSGAATAVSIVVGVTTLVMEASTDAPLTLAKVIPVSIHAVLDVLVSALSIAAPFLFGFSDETAPTAFFIVMGVVALLITIGTRFKPRHAVPA